MLIRFRVGNFLSFDREQTFSMLSGPTEIHKDHIITGDGFGLLRVSAIYGANASGKSNFVKALAAMRNMVVHNDPIVSDRYFRPRPENRDRPSIFEVEFASKGRLFSYGFEFIISRQTIVDEWLHELYTDRDSRIIFERTGSNIVHPFTGTDKERMDIYAEDMADNPRRLFLNVMGSRIRSKDVELRVFSEVREWFEKKLIIMNTDMPFSARHENIRLFTPMTPTIDRPVTVMSVVPLMLDIPLMGFWSLSISCFIRVPSNDGLKVFFTLIGMFFTQTG